jgi:hypothetical protein
MKTYWGGWGITPAVLTSQLDGSEWSAPYPGRFTHSTHCIGGWVGLSQSRCCRVGKNLLPLPGTEPRLSSPQPIAVSTELYRKDNFLKYYMYVLTQKETSHSNTRSSVFRDVMHCSPLKVNQCFGEHRLYLLGQRVSQKGNRREAGRRQNSS